MAQWRGYPILDDAHPDRPWWRLKSAIWTRSDDLTAPPETPLDPDDAEADLLALDTATPLADPKARPGQVWLWRTGNERSHRLVTSVEIFDGQRRPRFSVPVGPVGPGDWPPADAVALVWGPGSPWEPM